MATPSSGRSSARLPSQPPWPWLLERGPLLGTWRRRWRRHQASIPCRQRLWRPSAPRCATCPAWRLSAGRSCRAPPASRCCGLCMCRRPWTGRLSLRSQCRTHQSPPQLQRHEGLGGSGQPATAARRQRAVTLQEGALRRKRAPRPSDCTQGSVAASQCRPRHRSARRQVPAAVPVRPRLRAPRPPGPQRAETASSWSQPGLPSPSCHPCSPAFPWRRCHLWFPSTCRPAYRLRLQGWTASSTTCRRSSC
mmetsp:Transcript_58934/g.184968  ORF Transcript_58934/g.184968 Transcript_58934/m.184968 type:complete len:250 (+) Transcript_58934:192-941(+)